MYTIYNYFKLDYVRKLIHHHNILNPSLQYTETKIIDFNQKHSKYNMKKNLIYGRRKKLRSIFTM